MTLEGKTVVVTGAATGIGAAVSAGFAARGARVYGFDVTWDPGTPAVGGVEQVTCDVTDEKLFGHHIAQIEARHGAVDVLVNNAAMSGAVQPKPFDQISSNEWVQVVTNNTLAPFVCSKAVVTKMRRRKSGRIINLTSGTIFVGVPHVLHYVASKGAVAVMTKALAKELGDDGITVNAVAPGPTMTPSMRDNDGWTLEIQERSIQNRAIKREETANDLVGACLFFAGAGADFITGQILVVDGGYVFH